MENVLKAFPQELQRYDLWAFPDTTDSKLFKFKVNFSPFHLLLQNHRANFNQTEHKALLGEGDMGLFQWRVMPSLKGDKFNCMPWIFFRKSSYNFLANKAETCVEAFVGSVNSSLVKLWSLGEGWDHDEGGGCQIFTKAFRKKHLWKSYSEKTIRQIKL